MNKATWTISFLVSVALIAVVAFIGVTEYLDYENEQDEIHSTDSQTGDHASPVVTTSSTVAQASSDETEYEGPSREFGLPEGEDGYPMPEPCPADVKKPKVINGSYCGPPPPAGNGLGENGLCSGAELIPPCGPGVVRGTYYGYTMPGSCAGVMEFDDQLWLSRLPPPTDVPPFFVWMGYDEITGNPHFIGPGMVSFVRDDGSRTPCRGGVSLATS
jgi:hypothetical protein